MFTPAEITLEEDARDQYGWLLIESLTWSGKFRGVDHDLEVPASPDQPFSTDLASVPRSLTWLFPRYGKYTKAAVLHDYLCQNFRSAPPAGSTSSLLPLADRSDADEVFRLLMQELEVPWLRRTLMWGAVSWATMITSLVPGRRSNPVLRWVGRIVVMVSLVALLVTLFLRRDLASLLATAVLAPAVFMAGGTIALGRRDRIGPYSGAYLLTLAFSALLAIGIALGAVIYGFLLLEDAFGRFPATRKVVRDLSSPAAKLEKLGTPQFARLAAVLES